MPAALRPVPVRSEAAIRALCVSVLTRVPMLHHVASAEIRRTGEEASTPNWDLALVLPPLSEPQWRRARAAIEPWRHRFRVSATSDW